MWKWRQSSSYIECLDCILGGGLKRPVLIWKRWALADIRSASRSPCWWGLSLSVNVKFNQACALRLSSHAASDLFSGCNPKFMCIFLWFSLVYDCCSYARDLHAPVHACASDSCFYWRCCCWYLSPDGGPFIPGQQWSAATVSSGHTQWTRTCILFPTIQTIDRSEAVHLNLYLRWRIFTEQEVSWPPVCTGSKRKLSSFIFIFFLILYFTQRKQSFYVLCKWFLRVVWQLFLSSFFFKGKTNPRKGVGGINIKVDVFCGRTFEFRIYLKL